VFTREFEGLESVGDDGRDTVGGSLQNAADNQGWAFAGDGAVRLPQPLGAQNIDDPGFVLEIQEGDSLGRARALTVCDKTGNFEPTIRFRHRKTRYGYDTSFLKGGTAKLHGVPTG
jgi:hypothetical protein